MITQEESGKKIENTPSYLSNRAEGRNRKIPQKRALSLILSHQSRKIQEEGNKIGAHRYPLKATAKNRKKTQKSGRIFILSHPKRKKKEEDAEKQPRLYPLAVAGKNRKKSK